MHQFGCLAVVLKCLRKSGLDIRKRCHEGSHILACMSLYPVKMESLAVHTTYKSKVHRNSSKRSSPCPNSSQSLTAPGRGGDSRSSAACAAWSGQRGSESRPGGAARWIYSAYVAVGRAGKRNRGRLPIPLGFCYCMSMTEYLWIIFVGLAMTVLLSIMWYILAQPQGNINVRVDFDHYKDREGR